MARYLMQHMKFQPNIDAIKYAQEQGITVVIATGRAFYEAQAPVADTDLTVPYICLNGAEVRDETFNVMSTSHLNKSLVHKIKNVLKRCRYLLSSIHESCDLY